MHRWQYYSKGSKENLPLQKGPLKSLRSSLTREILNIQGFVEALYIVNFWNYVWLNPTFFIKKCSSEAQLKNEQKEVEMTGIVPMAPPLFTAKEKMVKLHLLSGKH